ncbi:ATP-binding protein [Lonepinella sp. MS14437]|uniref:AAA family ATPase n=1 Tax=unclassified Lonepinella TaxID=2642006 RepID=UPI0036DC0410
MSNITKDPLYYPRTELAERLVASLKDGISHALTLFAPRRMGKTQFLLQDIKPLAEEKGFHVCYFSFMDTFISGDNQTQGTDIQQAFCQALSSFLTKTVQAKLNKALGKIKTVEIAGMVGLDLDNGKLPEPTSPSRLLQEIAETSQKPVLMLFDEIQELARIKGMQALVKSLRTGLDMYQSKIKVIFTGSSTNGLRTMFNDSKAPFFHFAHALNFPNLGRDFTDFLADIYQQRVGKVLDKAVFFTIFQRLNYTPLYMRTITQNLIIDPDLSLEQAVQKTLDEIGFQNENVQQWQQLSDLEKQILRLIAQGKSALYSQDTRQQLANLLGVKQISSSTIQGKIKKLERADLITRGVGDELKINQPQFQTWLIENKI